MNLTPSLENYLEAIWLIGLDRKVVRVKDLAKRLKIRPASVVGGLRTLEYRGLVEHERYGYVELTGDGKCAAREVYKKHQVLFRFLHDMLGLEPEQAEEDACALEHHISNVGLERMMAFVNFVSDCPRGEPQCLKRFRDYAQTGAVSDVCSAPQDTKMVAEG